MSKTLTRLRLNSDRVHRHLLQNVFRYNCLEYLSTYKQRELGLSKDMRDLTTSEKFRFSLAERMNELELNQNLQLIHLTLTYKFTKEQMNSNSWQLKIANKTFISFYQYILLPYLFQKINFKRNKKIQPVTFAFIDDRPNEDMRTITNKKTIGLHHHAIMAVNKRFIDRIRQLRDLSFSRIGKTLLKTKTNQRILDNVIQDKRTKVFHQITQSIPTSSYRYKVGINSMRNIMTFDVTECRRNDFRLLYSSKKLKIYPDFLGFNL